MRVRTLLNPFNCLQTYEKKPLSELFEHFNGILDVEMGFGTGSFLIQYGGHHPERFVVGYEIRKRLVEAAQEKVDQAQLKNVKLFWGNGQKNLDLMFDDGVIDRIFIFHPDPWPKLGHQKRRLINQSFLELCHRKLKPGGSLYLASDVPELWDYMSQEITASKLFDAINDEYFWQTFYHTRWKELSIEQERTLHYQAYTRI